MSIRFGVTITQTDPQLHSIHLKITAHFIFRSMAKLRHPIAFRHVSSIYLFNDSKSILSELWVGTVGSGSLPAGIFHRVKKASAQTLLGGF